METENSEAKKNSTHNPNRDSRYVSKVREGKPKVSNEQIRAKFEPSGGSLMCVICTYFGSTTGSRLALKISHMSGVAGLGVTYVMLEDT